MKKAKLDLSEFMVLCREQGYFNLNDIQTAIFEQNGKLTVLPLSQKRPLMPEDIAITPKPEHINTEIIMDGQILHENIKRRGFDLKWLDKEIKKQGYQNAKDVFLAICDNEGKLTVFDVEKS